MTSTARRALTFFVLGMAVAVALQWLKAESFEGRWEGLLAVGEESALAPFVAADIPAVPLWESVGHDGQIYYAIARDPAGLRVPDLIEDPAYRYRRILYPLLSGLGGSASPHATVVGLVVTAAVGVGLSSSGLYLIGQHYGLRSWTTLLALLNPGAWLSAQMLLPDALAAGLALMGLGLALGASPWPGMALIGLAGAAKEQYVIVGAVLLVVHWGRGRRLQRALLLLGPTAAAYLWSLRIDGRSSGRSSLDLPFRGLIDALSTAWPQLPGYEILYTTVALASMLLAAAGSVWGPDRLLRAMNAVWLALATVLSGWVWGLGNNSARSLWPAGALGAIALAARRRSSVDKLPQELPGVAL